MPSADLTAALQHRYMGFWPRVAATLVDWVLMALVTAPPLLLIYGPGYYSLGTMEAGLWDVMISIVLPAALVIEFWRRKQATPGKMLFRSRVVCAETHTKPTVQQLVIRYLGYVPCILSLGLGLIWVAFDGRKQGWHDKMANTVVLQDP